MASSKNQREKQKGRSVAGLVVRALAAAIALFYTFVIVSLLLLRWIDPPTTAVQLERHFSAITHGKPYRKRFAFVPMEQISPALQHAVVAAEDARFYQHHGFDWKEVQIAVQEDLDKGRSRGASTITQQLARNLFLSTNRSYIRKGIEFSIVPPMEFLLSKKRILELYLNVIEWGPGVYGAEASSRYYFQIPAKQLTREQGIELASILPSPLRWKPGHLTEYDRIISDRMTQMGW